MVCIIIRNNFVPIISRTSLSYIPNNIFPQYLSKSSDIWLETVRGQKLEKKGCSNSVWAPNNTRLAARAISQGPQMSQVSEPNPSS